MARAPLSLAVVGVGHPNRKGPSRAFGIALCKPGDPIELRPEPKNPADEHAVAVYSSGDIQLGYLTAERAPWIGAMLKQGREIDALFQRATPFGAWIRIGFDGEIPKLPTEDSSRFELLDRDAADLPAPDFYPDDEPPDW